MRELQLIRNLIGLARAVPRFFEDGELGEHDIARQLRTLAASFYIVGLVALLATCVSIPNLMVLLFMTITPARDSGTFVPTPEMVPWIAGGVFLFFIVVMIVERLCFFTCQCISQRRRYSFVRKMAWFSFLLIPLGPALCWFAIRLLNRPTVRAQFAKEV